MPDSTALVALVIAAVALVITAAQLLQQLLATGYVLRKCDRIITGSFIPGGTRRWHWRQFRFSVKYKSIAFALPDEVYESLGVIPAMGVGIEGERTDASPNTASSAHLFQRKIVDYMAHSLLSRNVTDQACWITLVQDLLMSGCLQLENMRLQEESGDRIPDDLTVAPIRVDALTLLYMGISLGMQVHRYSPNMGEISMAGAAGSISSSSHPVLGTLTHYSTFNSRVNPRVLAVSGKFDGPLKTRPRLSSAMTDTPTLCDSGGVVANTLFGRFRDRKWRNEFVPLAQMRNRHKQTLARVGWPRDSYNDTIDGAATFMAFAHADMSRVSGPSVVKPWSAHFAEFIVAMHHADMIKRSSKPFRPESIPIPNFDTDFLAHRNHVIRTYGSSSPYVDWNSVPSASKNDARIDEQLITHINSPFLLLNASLAKSLGSILNQDGLIPDTYPFNNEDPSEYVNSGDCWEMVQRADQCLSYLACEHRILVTIANLALAKAICPLAEVGPISWRTASLERCIETWPQDVSHACDHALTLLPTDISEDERKHCREWLPLYTRLSLLRASYFTLSMRGSPDVGAGLTEDAPIETALLYMA